MFAQVVVSFFLVCIGFKAYSSLSSSIPSDIVDQSLSKSGNKDHGNDSNVFPTVSLLGSETQTQANLKQVTKGTSTTTAELSNEVVANTYGLRWYPQAPYAADANDESFDSWKRCGSGAYVDNDDHRNPGTYESFCNVGNGNDIDMTNGDDCQTISPYGAQMLDGVDSIFFKLLNEQGSFTGSDGHQYYGVIKLFEATYCTGTGVEFYAQAPRDLIRKDVPRDEKTHTPYDNGFGSWRKIRSFYVYAKPHDSSLIPISLNSIGFKLMPFPDYDMKPEDQTSCVQGHRAYVPFTDEANWPGLDCVSSFDRKFCMTTDDNDWEKEAMYQSADPSGDSFDCIDFAGCITCGGDTASNSVYNSKSPCYGSTLPYLNAFPLGSFYHNVYTIQGNEICSDSQMSDPFSDRMLYCDNQTWYENWCITIKIYDCYSRTDDCPKWQDGVVQALPDNPNKGPFFYISTPINLFCPDQTYGHRDGWEGGRKDDLSSISYYDKTTTLMGTAENAPNAEGGYGWPQRTTGYIAHLTYCQGDGSKLMDF